MNDKSFKDAWQALSEARYVLIITHINPDADTICSALAISNLLFEQGIKHKVFNVSKKLPPNVDFLNRFDKIVHQLPKSYDLIISLDCGDKKRFGFELQEDIKLINIDHHASNDDYGDINIVDENAASTAELVYKLFRVNGLNISKASAESIYCGIYDDSLGLATMRCSKSTFEAVADLVGCGVDVGYVSDMLIRRDSLAKYRLLPKVLDSLELHFEGKVALIYLKNEWLKISGAASHEAEEALDMVLKIAVSDIAVFLRESKTKIRVSLRSKNGVDVSTIAMKLGGGGHKMAAGCTLETDSIDAAKEIILNEIENKG